VGPHSGILWLLPPLPPLPLLLLLLLRDAHKAFSNNKLLACEFTPA
jgi:hypothetical protein